MSTEITTGNAQSSEVVRQGAGGTEIERRREVAQSSLAAQARASIEAQYVMALQHPRSWDNVRVKLLNESKRPGFADAAIYGKPQRTRDANGRWVESKIEGLSIRFAETAMRIAGNMRAGSLTTYDDDEKRFHNVYCVDLESNAISEKAVAVTKIVERREVRGERRVLGERTNTAGDTVFIVQATDDELAQKEGALINKTKRNLILSLIPGDIREECERECRATRKAAIKSDPDAARKKLIDAFAELRVLPANLEEYLGHALDLASPAELETLRAIYVGLREGDVTWPELIADKAKPPEEQEKAKGLAAKIAENRAKAKAGAP